MNGLVQGEDGQVYYAKFEPITHDKFKEGLTNMGSIAAPKYQCIPSRLTGIDGDLYVRGKEAFVYCRQNFLSVNTKWTPWKTVINEEEKVFFEPTFSQGLVEQKVIYDLSENPLYLIYREKGSAVKDFYAIFVEYKRKKLSTFYVALPNFYLDGKVCLGNDNTIVGKRITDRFEDARKIFNESSYQNEDLWSERNFPDCKKKHDVKASWFVDPDFKPINSPVEGKLRFVNEEVNEMIMSIIGIGGEDEWK